MVQSAEILKAKVDMEKKQSNKLTTAVNFNISFLKNIILNLFFNQILPIDVMQNIGNFLF